MRKEIIFPSHAPLTESQCMLLSLTLVVAKRRDGAWLLVRKLYFAELLLIAQHVFLQCGQQALCVLRSQNNTALHPDFSEIIFTKG